MLHTLFVLCYIVVVFGDCPDLQGGMRRWSKDSDWPSGQRPVAGEDVVIADAVLLDVTTPRLNTITIEPNGLLVWSPEGDFTVTASYISIYGRMDIGSEDCKFDAKAHILLTGDIDTAPSLDQWGNQKLIGIHANGTLEIHGMKKLSWTKLTETVNKENKNTGLVFDYTWPSWIAVPSSRAFWFTPPDPTAKPKKGTHVYVFDATTGAQVKNERFVTHTTIGQKVASSFRDYLDGIEDGRLVMITSPNVVYSSWIDKEPLYEAMERLAYGSVTGESLYRQVVPDSKDSYVLITVKGSPSLTREALTPESSDEDRTFASTILWDSELKVSAEKSGSYFNFRILTIEAAFPIINVLDDTSTWLPGDRVLLTSTDYDWAQAEEATVVECLQCSPYQVQVELDPKFMHWGEVVDGVDERGEVALLTRNILVEGEMRDSCPPANNNCDVFDFDTFGAHIKTLGPGFKNFHVEGIEVYHGGQQTKIGRYPIHFHMGHDVDDPVKYPSPPYVRDNSIHHSFCRCITIHGTSGVTVMDNVGYDILGHCFFLEDGGERRNTIDGNLGASIKAGDIIPSDREKNPSVFWITNPKNYVRNNVAAGSVGVGIWYIYPPEPWGPSEGLGFMKLHEARETAIWECTNNVAHSTSEGGFIIDNELDRNGVIVKSNFYSAKQTPLLEGSPSIEATVTRNNSFADSAEGLTFAGHDSEVQFLNTSVIVGETANTGEPTVINGINYGRSSPRNNLAMPIIGFVQYDGPVIVYDTWFNGFVTNEHRPAGAYGFTRNMNHATSAVQPTFALKFAFDDGLNTGNRIYEGEFTEKFFGELEGDYSPTLRDLDGTMTGYEGSTVVRTTPLHLTDKCYTRPNWKISVCPYKYGKIVAQVAGVKIFEHHAPFMMRDDIPDVKEIHQSQEDQTGFSVILGEQYSYTLHWAIAVPSLFKVRGLAAEKDSPVRVGICLPLDAEFDLKRYGSYSYSDLSKWEEASSVAEVDNDDTGKKYFWDSQTGLLFVKLGYKNSIDPYYQKCPNQKCEVVTVTLLSGTVTDGDCSGRAYGPYVRQVMDTKPVLSQPNLPKTSATPPAGYGTGETRPFVTRSPVHGGFGPWGDWEECSLTCGGGVQVKRRLCNDPLPQHGGQNCDQTFTERYQTQSCNVQLC